MSILLQIADKMQTILSPEYGHLVLRIYGV